MMVLGLLNRKVRTVYPQQAIAIDELLPLAQITKPVRLTSPINPGRPARSSGALLHPNSGPGGPHGSATIQRRHSTMTNYYDDVIAWANEQAAARKRRVLHMSRAARAVGKSATRKDSRCQW